MDKIKNFFELNILEFIPILIGIYFLLNILKIDIYIIGTIILFGCYFYYRYNLNEDEKVSIINTKKEERFKNVIPSLINKYNDIIDFLYFISDFKQYNQKVYDDLLVNLNDFLTLYEDSSIITGNKKKLYNDIILDTKQKIMDNMSSFIYSINNSPILREKLNISINKLNTILLNYMEKLNIKEDSINPANNYL
jgi:hypothetical protein